MIKYLRKSNYREKTYTWTHSVRDFHMDSQCQRFPPVVIWVCCLWPVFETDIMKAVCGRGKKREKELVSQYFLQDHSPNDLASFYLASSPKGFTISQWHKRLAIMPQFSNIFPKIRSEILAPCFHQWHSWWTCTQMCHRRWKVAVE
jgi:hypothetical protein